MIPLALFLLRFTPKPLRPWVMGLILGRKPERLEFRDGKWRLPEDSAMVNKALEGKK